MEYTYKPRCCKCKIPDFLAMKMYQVEDDLYCEDCVSEKVKRLEIKKRLKELTEKSSEKW